ncbi:putative odorant receptor 92a [Hermetia illucens]|uniref:putative odorant receptor 92a n=1 Tax=Hermetia illucens TaxID=343691 RepID=UPI0018CC6363|nr:putative odorant receptor 92a [Hermetia illucens]
MVVLDVKLVSYETFMTIPTSMYKTVGVNLKRLRGRQSFWTALNFWVGFTNLNAIILAEFIFLYKTFGQFSSFLEVTAIAPCLGFCIMSDFKISAILSNIASIENVQQTLNTIFPRTATAQQRCFAGYTAVTFTISADILMCCIVTQLAMNFDMISREVRKFEPSGTEGDLEFLRRLIRKHQVLLRVSEELNSIFSPSILFNFLASSLIICLVGFQATAGVAPLDFFKYLLFLLASLLQILLICYFGNMLIDSSSDIANGAYEHNWIVADEKYKKLLLFLIMRGQRASALKVVTFDDVSLRSFMKVCSISYQFFALLRTVYSK